MSFRIITMMYLLLSLSACKKVDLAKTQESNTQSQSQDSIKTNHKEIVNVSLSKNHFHDSPTAPTKDQGEQALLSLGEETSAEVREPQISELVDIKVKAGLPDVQISTPATIFGKTNAQGILEFQMKRKVEDFLIAQKLGYKIQIIEVHPDGVQEIFYFHMKEKGDSNEAF